MIAQPVLVKEIGGGVPGGAIREVVDNLVHAGLAGAVVTILDGGDTVRVSDRGPGIPDKDRARAPGFTAAGPREQALVRGVGAGLAIASDLMAQANGTMEIDDNLGRGTVVTLRVPPGDAHPALSEGHAATTADLSGQAAAGTAPDRRPGSGRTYAHRQGARWYRLRPRSAIYWPCTTPASWKPTPRATARRPKRAFAFSKLYYSGHLSPRRRGRTSRY